MFFWAAVFFLVAPVAALLGFAGMDAAADNMDGLIFIFGFGLMWLIIVMAVAVLARHTKE